MQRSVFGEGGVGAGDSPIFGAGDSPNSHAVLNVVFLSDCVMSCVDCPGVFVHCGLGCDVFGSLVISVEMVDIGRVAVEL